MFSFALKNSKRYKIKQKYPYIEIYKIYTENKPNSREKIALFNCEKCGKSDLSKRYRDFLSKPNCCRSAAYFNREIHPRRSTLEKYKASIKIRNNDKFEVLSGKYHSKRDVLEFRCKDCGYVFKQVAEYMMEGRRCVACLKNNKMPLLNSRTDKYKRQIHIKYGNSIKVIGFYSGRKVEILHNCVKHGQFEASPDTMMHKLTIKGCVKCGVMLRADKKRKTHEQVCLEIKSRHGDKVKINEKYRNSLLPHEFICDKGHKWQTTPDSVIRTSGCPRCCRSPSHSKIADRWLDDCEERYKCSLTREHRIYLPGHERSIRVDGFDKNTNTVYEFYGDYYHGNPNIFDPEQILVGYKTAGELYDKVKTRHKALREEGYKVVFIWEDTYQSRVKNR